MILQPDEEPIADVLGRYGLANSRWQRLTDGHINATYRVDCAGKVCVLQRMHPVFAPEVQFDFQQVSAHLCRQGLLAPQLLPTLEGKLWVSVPGPADKAPTIWRLQTFLVGDTLQHADLGSAGAAGEKLGQIHRALQSFVQPLRAARAVHNLPGHLQGLRDALAGAQTHVAEAQIRPVASAILQAAEALPPQPPLPLWLVHGDPKLSNFLFAPLPPQAAGGAATGPAKPRQALAMVDFDTFNRLPISMELGDAWRSWCNPFAEDDPQSCFSLELFEAAAAGYRAGLQDSLRAPERAALGLATESIALELAARFARDALLETYFGWDRQRFATSWAHQLQRARSQLSLARSHAAQRRQVQSVVDRLF